MTDKKMPQNSRKISRRSLLRDISVIVLSIVPASRALAWLGTRMRKSSKSTTNSKFIAVGASGIIFTSPNGITWTSRTSGVTANLIGIGSSGSKYLVSTATSGQLLASTDGLAWTSLNCGMGYAVHSISYGGGRWVVGGGSGYTASVYGSPDGINWTTISSGLPAVVLGSTYANGQFILIGAAQATGTSPDGLTFTSRRSGVGGNDYYGVAASPANCAIVGASYASGYYKSVLLTSDFSTFTSVYSGTSGYIYAVVWTGSQYCAVGQSGLIITSPTGSTWTTQTSGISTDLTGIAWNGSLFCAVGAGGKILTSPTGVTWTSQTSGTTSDFAATLAV